MPDKARDGRNVALKFLSDCWRARSSKKEFLQLQYIFEETSVFYVCLPFKYRCGANECECTGVPMYR